MLGSPIAHSLSPLLHNAGYAALGLSDWEYSSREVTEADCVDLPAAAPASTLIPQHVLDAMYS